jgi:hypothetical protein
MKTHVSDKHVRERAGGVPAAPSWGYACLAIACLCVCAALLWPSADPNPEAHATESLDGFAPTRAGPASETLAAASDPGAGRSDPWLNHPWRSAGTQGAAVSDDLADHVPQGSAPPMKEVIERLHRAGVYTGLGAFQPPGTKPPLVGLAVPEGYVLPDGYVRHQQATDDGQTIEAILMFAPDRVVLDSAGRPIPVPPDRVVPASLAPPGFPIRTIVIPAPHDRTHR